MGQIKVTKASIEGLYVIEPAVHGDERGYFMETYNLNDMKEAGLNLHFVQDNQSMSTKGVLRGLHFQKQYPQLDIYYDVVKNDDFLNSLDNYIKTNQIDIITLTSYKRNIFSRLFNPGIARKMIFHSDTPLLVIYGQP